MAKQKVTNMCEACGHETLKWMGKCPRCGAWDTIREIKIEAEERQERQTTGHHRRRRHG